MIYLLGVGLQVVEPHRLPLPSLDTLQMLPSLAAPQQLHPPQVLLATGR